MTNNEILLSGMFAQLYARLVTAAILKTHVFYSDLAPIVFGIQLSEVSTAQYDALWGLVATSMSVDISHGRAPLAALYVSRSTDDKKPSRKFFREYHKITGKHLSDKEWQALVQQVYTQYESNLREPS
ncbi:hypothetical protein MPK64_gp327 [Erwinia phage pEa_SNUABM_16]|uniref:Uncharacterized protein n=1 Tax=Erwinia phage pEa_SNUABM_16 TaxID=2869544 RepID=A0AAE8XRF1_9CAUD|nr:hypothetical protein MPK64_gp327 [Erwinia phage pEa_SNUABM_16]UAW96471.1 hypothetical protein pEaSNUABM16_00327 [Erwinia phage pEa_SNUABM_16]